MYNDDVYLEKFTNYNSKLISSSQSLIFTSSYPVASSFKVMVFGFVTYSTIRNNSKHWISQVLHGRKKHHIIMSIAPCVVFWSLIIGPYPNKWISYPTELGSNSGSRARLCTCKSLKLPEVKSVNTCRCRPMDIDLVIYRLSHSLCFRLWRNHFTNLYCNFDDLGFWFFSPSFQSPECVANKHEEECLLSLQLLESHPNHLLKKVSHPLFLL